MNLPSNAKKWRPHQYSLMLDWETSGYSYPDYAAKHQGITLGVIVYELKTLKTMDERYYEIQFDASKYEWDKRAEEVHGISQEHLAANGKPPSEVALDLANLIYKYWAHGDVTITAYNPEFDIAFTRQLLEPFSVMPGIFFRKLDVSICSALLYGTPYADDLFHLTGLAKRDKHNALEDCQLTLEALRVMKNRLEFADGRAKRP